jgi:excinuclease ABC subunit B
LKAVRETVRSYDTVEAVAGQYSAETEAGLKDGSPIRLEDIPMVIASLERDMKDLARAMEFEKAAEVRDEIQSLRGILGTADGRLGMSKRKVTRFAGKR